MTSVANTGAIREFLDLLDRATAVVPDLPAERIVNEVMFQIHVGARGNDSTDDQRLRAAASKRGTRERRLSKGLCVNCGAPAVPGRPQCQGCFERSRAHRAKRRDRVQALQASMEGASA